MKDCSCTRMHRDGYGFPGNSACYEFMDLLVPPNFEEIEIVRTRANDFEHLYKCLKCGRIWRLVEVDPPSAGVWELHKS